jgi:hypothetical protein
MSAIQSIREFIASANYRDLVSLGYEIETQFEGEEKEFNSDAFWDNYSPSDDMILSYLGLSFNREWQRYINNNVSGGLIAALGVDEDGLQQYAYDMEYENEDSEYWEEEEKSREEIDGFQTVSDGSVTGWEFKTRSQLDEGGIDYTTALELSEQFYDELPSSYAIDDECSCHVHIKVLGVRYHRGSYKLYMLILDELSKVWASDIVPENILERIKNCRHFYSPKANHTDKYNTVRIHPQGTWEFRLWGNCQDSSEVKFCVDNTIECFRKAYFRYYARDTKLFDTVEQYAQTMGLKYNQIFETIAREAMVSGDTIDNVLSEKLAIV